MGKWENLLFEKGWHCERKSEAIPFKAATAYCRLSVGFHAPLRFVTIDMWWAVILNEAKRNEESLVR